MMSNKATDCSEDYVIVETHQSKPHPMSMNSSYTYLVVDIFASKAKADVECARDEYKWSGNGTGSVGYKVVKRSEVPDEVKW